MYKPIQCIALSIALLSPAAHALEADPASILINTLESAIVIRLTDSGEPLKPGDVTTTRFMVEDSNYSRMVKVTPVDGGVRLEPTPDFEVGSYDLVIETKRGTITVPVSAPLNGEQGLLEQRTEALGGARNEAMRDVGLATSLPRGTVSFKLEPQYTVGQALRIDAPATPGAAMRWLANGDVAAEGPTGNVLAYVFPAEGDYLLQLQQRRAGTEWEIISEASTLVIEPEPIVMTAKPGQRISFTAPDGYQQYTWVLAGITVSEQRKAALTFPTPGKHELTCRCDRAAGEGFRLVRYEVTAQ
jgi:hypothetical protein